VKTNQAAPGPVIAALADDTRRSVFELLADRPMAVGDLAARLPVSRPAVSQHLKVLEGAGLVDQAREGTRHIYSVTPEGTKPLVDYLDRMWSAALDRYSAAADELKQNKKAWDRKVKRRESR